MNFYPGQLLYVAYKIPGYLDEGDVVVVREKIPSDWVYKYDKLIYINDVNDTLFFIGAFIPIPRKSIKEKIKIII